MKKLTKSKKKKGSVSTLLNSRYTYIFLLLGVIGYRFTNDTVLNIPLYIYWLTLGIAAVLVFGFLLFVSKKLFKTYTKDGAGVLGLVIFIVYGLIMAIIIRGIIAIPFNMYIANAAKDAPVEYFECPITNVITTGIDKVHFKFMGKSYSRYFDTQGKERTKLMQNHVLVLTVRKSRFNSYYMESAHLKEIQ